MLQPNRNKRLALGVATGIVAALGWVGDWYGRTDMGDVYPSDAVSYLDCARAFGRGDFTSALNPLWNQGYPALLALVRPLFPAGPEGIWNAAHVLNLALFLIGWFVFAWLVRELVVEQRGESEAHDGAGLLVGFGALCIFLTAQLCTDQVSRVGPDKLAAVFFFLACALVLRLLRRPGYALAAALGLVLGLGFLAKSALLLVGCVVLATVALSLRRSLRYVLPAAALFAMIVLSYGAALSHANGWRTLGESGSINYAWHVDRLQKWVHWEGGTLPASQAWTSPRLAQFALWDSAPPDFGMPEHPTRPVGVNPTIYQFRGPRDATYDPYYDPPYYYRGYHHIVRWRYQAIAVGKNTGHLILAFGLQPLFWAFVVLLIVGLRAQPQRARFRAWLRQVWPLLTIGSAGALVYVPVHLEPRYISAALAVLALIVLLGLAPLLRSVGVAVAILALGLVLGLVHDQRGGWSDALHGITHRDNRKWKIGMAVRDAGLPRGAEIGMIGRGANLDTDWATIGEVRVTSEIQSGPDEAAFVAMSPEQRAEVLKRFQDYGEVAVLSGEQIVGQLPGWQKLGDAPVWMYRFSYPN